jgi:hypothetical protein
MQAGPKLPKGQRSTILTLSLRLSKLPMVGRTALIPAVTRTMAVRPRAMAEKSKQFDSRYLANNDDDYRDDMDDERVNLMEEERSLLVA